MRRIITLLIIFNSTALCAQSYDISVGASYNSFFSLDKNAANLSSYQSDFGYGLGFGLELKTNAVFSIFKKHRFSLQYEKYGGKVKIGTHALGGNSIREVVLDKSVISLGFYPLNLSIKKFDLNVGLVLSALLNEKYSGRAYGNHINTGSWEKEINESDGRMSTETCLGVRVRLTYGLGLSKYIVLKPQYSYYIGLSNDIDLSTKSMRHFLALSVMKEGLN